MVIDSRLRRYTNTLYTWMGGEGRIGVCEWRERETSEGAIGPSDQSVAIRPKSMQHAPASGIGKPVTEGYMGRRGDRGSSCIEGEKKRDIMWVGITTGIVRRSDARAPPAWVPDRHPGLGILLPLIRPCCRLIGTLSAARFVTACRLPALATIPCPLHCSSSCSRIAHWAGQPLPISCCSGGGGVARRAGSLLYFLVPQQDALHGDEGVKVVQHLQSGRRGRRGVGEGHSSSSSIEMRA